VTKPTERAFQLATSNPGTLEVSGVLSFDTAAAARQAIQAALRDRTIAQLDLAGIRHSDSAGLACVLAVAAEAARQGHPLQIIHMPVGMQALARVCEVDRLIG
jgi:phospholipid transport system transporter-binding protein